MHLENLFEKENADQQESFFQELREILECKDFPCKVILVLREQYLGRLSSFEKLIPELLEHRFHLDHFAPTEYKPAISGMLNTLVSQDRIRVDQSDQISQQIADQFQHQKCEKSLSCLQIYMHQMHQKACSMSQGQKPTFDVSLVREMGPSEKVIDQHIRKKRKSIEKQLPKASGNPPFTASTRELEHLDFLENNCCSTTQPSNNWLILWRRHIGKVRTLNTLLLISLLGLLGSIITHSILYDYISSDKHKSTEYIRDTIRDTLFLPKINGKTIKIGSTIFIKNTLIIRDTIRLVEKGPNPYEARPDEIDGLPV